MRLLWEDRAWSEYLYWQTQDKKTLKRINALIKDIQRSLYTSFVFFNIFTCIYCIFYQIAKQYC